MSHLVEQMAYTGATPWHGLGNRIDRHQPLEAWQVQAGLNWEIKDSPVSFVEYGKSHLGRIFKFEEHKVLYRSDNHAPLSVVSQRYKVVQPRDILEFYRDLTEVSGFELETAGCLKGGRKIWALARTGQSGMLKGNDETRAYVLLATACDGTMATTAQFTSIRVVCNNTLAVALAGDGQAVKVSHRSAFDADTVKRQLGISVTAWDDFMYRLKTLSERKVQPREARTYFERVFSGPTGQPREQLVSKAQVLFNGEGMGSQLPSSHNTAYGLLNAVTEFVDHQRRACSTDHRLDSAWFGQGATLKEKALTEALQLMA